VSSIISGILSIVAVIRELIKLVYMFIDLQAQQKAKDALKKEKEREAAVAKQKNAKEEKDFDDAQDSIASNKP
jgi:uncharacterized membrane protein